MNENTHSRMQPLSPVLDWTGQTFASGGWLQSGFKLEHRPQQEAMAMATAQAFFSDQSLLVEAGTGVGKSLAYLVPGALHALHAKRPFIVSSHTIALQEQLKNKDIPLVRELFRSTPELEPFADFKVALLVGRGNYLCGHRLAQAIQTKGDLFAQEEMADLERIAHWSAETETGLREELTPAPMSEVWEWVNADSSACNRRNCTPETCFYRRAMQQRAEANVIIVNHSLLFSLISAGLSPGGEAAGVLYPGDFLVLDEAHTVPDIAADHFGLHLSSYSLDRSLKLLYNPKKKKGFLSRIGGRRDHLLIVQALAASQQFFSDLKTRFLQKRDVLRMLEPNWADPLLNEPLGRIYSRLKVLEQDIDNKDTREDLKDHAARIKTQLTSINQAIELRDEDHVYWLEKSGRSGQLVTLRSAPLEVSEYLRETIFNRRTSAVLASATLAHDQSMKGFQKNVGAEPERTQIEASPFDYQRNMQVFVATDSPAPSPREGRLDIDYLADMIQFCALRVEGGTLALFTSYADLSRVADRVAESIHNAGRELLVQGRDFSRSELKTRFLDAENGILFGTDSFWTGFDAPGPALSQVIICRLPFVNPSHPLPEAKAEKIKARGGSPFSELTLPDALIKFRQGVGRLIRSRSDTGLITILDSRILQKSYGRQFLAALPKQGFTRFSKTDREESFPFFARH